MKPSSEHETWHMSHDLKLEIQGKKMTSENVLFSYVRLGVTSTYKSYNISYNIFLFHRTLNCFHFLIFLIFCLMLKFLRLSFSHKICVAYHLVYFEDIFSCLEISIYRRSNLFQLNDEEPINLNFRLRNQMEYPWTWMELLMCVSMTAICLTYLNISWICLQNLWSWIWKRIR